MKVYCNDCVYRINVVQCEVHPYIEDTPWKRKIRYQDVIEINRNNDCPYYKPTLWKQIKNLLLKQ